MISDQEIVEKCIQEGNEHFEELIKRHSNYIYGFMMRLTGGNQMFAEDLTQTAFLRAISYLKSYNPEKEFRVWLATIAINCFRTEVKKHAKYNLEENMDHISANEQRGDNQDFYKLISHLSADERTILTMKYIYDYKNADIARDLNMNLNTIIGYFNLTWEEIYAWFNFIRIRNIIYSVIALTTYIFLVRKNKYASKFHDYLINNLGFSLFFAFCATLIGYAIHYSYFLIDNRTGISEIIFSFVHAIQGLYIWPLVTFSLCFVC